MGLAMWSVAVVGILHTMAWVSYDDEGNVEHTTSILSSNVCIGVFRSTQTLTLDLFSRWMLPIGCVLVALSVLPLPRYVLLGNGGQPIFSILALPMWLFACGLVAASQYILLALTTIMGWVGARLKTKDERYVFKQSVLSKTETV